MSVRTCRTVWNWSLWDGGHWRPQTVLGQQAARFPLGWLANLELLQCKVRRNSTVTLIDPDPETHRCIPAFIYFPNSASGHRRCGPASFHMTEPRNFSRSGRTNAGKTTFKDSRLMTPMPGNGKRQCADPSINGHLNAWSNRICNQP